MFKKYLIRCVLGCVLAALLLQALFALRVASWTVIDPSTTTFQRAEYARLLREKFPVVWKQEWRDYDQIADTLKSAVIASEDSAFIDHEGVDWDAIQSAWEGNNKGKRIKGGSTITQQLAKNLLLAGERSYARKGEELLLSYLLEAFLGKQRILEIYLNNVELGEGVFGAQAAALHYFKTDASKLSAYQAARLAVMLPRPRYFEQRRNSSYLDKRARVIVRRMGLVDLP
jgi:monofunctional glycosyltransferase